MWLRILLQISICAVIGVHRTKAECQESTIEVEKSYEIIPGDFDFETATQRCVRFGGRLARITNVAEHRAVRTVLQKTEAKKRLSWIGYRKVRGARDFTDSDSGAAIGAFRRFLPAVLPITAPKDMCATAGSSKIFPALWGEKDCSATASALCEFPKIPDEYEYVIVSSQGLINYAEAKALCSRSGAEIAIFDNEQDYAPLKSSVSKSSRVLFVGYKQVRKVWVTDKGAKVTNLAADRFLPNNGQDACAGSRPGTHKWGSYGCDSKVAYGAICKKIKAGSGHSGDKIFYYIISTGNYYSLSPQCELDGGTVAKIESVADQQAVVGLLARAKVNVLRLFFRSVFVATNGKVTWSDKTPLKFTNFASRPDQGFGCPNIEYTINRRGSWSVSSCTKPKSGILCMKDPKHVSKPGVNIDIDIDISFVTKTYILLQSTTLLTFGQWQTRCKTYGGQLAHITDAKSQETVTQLMTKTNFEAMIGARRSSIDITKFIYQGGKAVQYTNWDSHQPSPLRSRPLVCLRQKLYNPGKWISCRETSLAAVCEVYGGGASSQGGDVKEKISIEDVKKRFRVVFIDAGLSYESLSKKCASIGGVPAVLESVAENEKARRAIADSGGSRALIGLRREGATLKWTSGSAAKFRNFAKGDLGGQPCVEMAEYGGTWTSVSCAKNRMLCQLEEFGSGSTNKLPPGYEWDIKYVFVRGWTSKKWADWSAICKSKGGQLPLILDRSENTAFEKFMKDSSINGFVFLGGQKVGALLKWSDGSLVYKFSNFEPQTITSAPKGCIGAKAESGRWIFGDCDTLKTRYGVCEIRTKKQVTKLPPDPSVTNGKKFFVISDRRTLTYEDWRAKCQQMDGDLAVIETATEQVLVTRQMRHKLVPALIAPKKAGSAFTNPGNKPLKFSNFMKGDQPGSHLCVSVLNGWFIGAWQYSPCRAQSAVCESQVGDKPKPVDDRKKIFIVLTNPKKLDYNAWQAQCQKRGGELAVISNVAEQDAANAIIKPLDKPVLIGPRRSSSNINKFVTKEGRQLTFTNWQSGEPNLLWETCVEMYTGGAVGKWNDKLCPHEYALCQVVGRGGPTLAAAKKIYRVIDEGGAELKYEVWEQKCRQIGGNLAIINSAAEQQAAQEVIKSARFNAFIAGKRLGSNLKVFINPDGRTLSYTNWNAGEPNNLFKEPCIEMYNWGKVVGKWNDVKCTSRRAALCQLYEGTVVTEPTNTNSAKEFFVLQNSKALEYDEWSARCRARHGELALIETAHEQLTVTNLLKAYTHAPITAVRRNPKDIWAFIRPDGKKLGYTNWKKGEPNYLWETCVQVYTGKFGQPAGTWNDITCKQNSALCQKTGKKPAPAPPAPAAKTFVVIDEGSIHPYATWASKCRSRGGQLARIENAADQKAAEAAIARTRHAVLVDGRRGTGAAWRIFSYATGKALSYSNWNAGEPNNRFEECIQLYTNGPIFGKWNDVPCNQRAALCQVPGSKPTFGTTPGKKYEVMESNKKISFATWQQQCQAKGGRLATINSAAEQKAVEATLRTTRKRVVLIGITRDPKNLRQFITPDGKPVTYTNWNSGEPNSYHERCIEVFNEKRVFGKWNDIPCAEEAALCETGESSPEFGAAKRYEVLEESKKLPITSWQAKCMARGGMLAPITSAEDQKMVEEALKKSSRRSALIGVQRNPKNPKQFINPDFKPITFAKWNRGEPNDVRETCVEMYNDPNARGLWNDIRCESDTAVCQFGHTAPVVVAAKTYRVFEESKRLSITTWKEKCRAKGGRLASITNANDQRAVEMALRRASRNSALLGITRNPKNLAQFINPDGKPITVAKWYSGEPNSRSEKCVEIYGSDTAFGRWNDIRCDHNTAVCEFGGPVSSPPPKRYEVLSGKTQSIAAWRSLCKQKGGGLASIHSDAEQKKVLEALKKTPPPSHRAMLGIIRNPRRLSDFINPDGELIKFNKWARGEPNSIKEACTEIYTFSHLYGYWNDRPCEADAVVCEI